jgi:hypothetical protein
MPAAALGGCSLAHAPTDPWAAGVRAADVPINAPPGWRNPLEAVSELGGAA